MKAEGTRKSKAIPNAANMHYALDGLKENVAKVKSMAPKRTAWMETALAESLTVMQLREGLRKPLRTFNGIERINEEHQRPVNVISYVRSDVSCLRLASAILMELSDVWQPGKTNLNLREKTIDRS